MKGTKIDIEKVMAENPRRIGKIIIDNSGIHKWIESQRLRWKSWLNV